MEGIRQVPKEILALVPKYDGDENLLNLFVSKCEYVLSGSRIAGNVVQELYLFHALSSRLIGRAASLISDHPNITSWDSLKEILTQHFGDPRSEECIAIELESMKMKQGETYIKFCHRIQNTKSSLVAKVNRLTDEGIKAAKLIIYNNTAMNVFLFNLPEDLIRIVRLKSCTNLEDALSIVTEEVNFQFQYNAKNKLTKQNSAQPSTLQNSFKSMPVAQGIKPIFNLQPSNNNFKFGNPQHTGFKPNFVPSNKFTPPQGYRFGVNPNQPQRNFNQLPFQQARAPFQHNGYKFGIPQQQGFKFGIQNQPQTTPNQQQAPRLVDSDVSMRTAPVRQNMIANDLYYIEEPSSCQEYISDNNYDYYYDHNTNEQYNEYVEQPSTDCNYLEYYNQSDSTQHETINPENFQETASDSIVK